MTLTPFSLSDSLFKVSTGVSTPKLGNDQGDNNVNVLGNNNQVTISTHETDALAPTKNDMSFIFDKLIKGAGIRVNRNNLEPICPSCYSHGKVSYLHYKENEKDLDGNLSTVFECLESGCNFYLQFVHEKPWQEMLVDL